MIEKSLQAKRIGKLIFFAFTKEMMRNYGSSALFKLGRIIEEKREIRTISNHASKEEIKEKVHEIVEIKEKELDNLVKNERFNKKTTDNDFFPVPSYRLKKITFKNPDENLSGHRRQVPRMRIIIPETKLPEKFSYLKPIPFEADISLGKLDELIKDQAVKMIECNGENDEIIVKGDMGEMNTAITLTNAEIEDIINNSSSKTKIPAHEGVYKVVFGKLMLMAIVSTAVGSRFIIKKIEPQKNSSKQY